MRSRFHRGQFYASQLGALADDSTGTYKRVVWVVGRLRHEDDGARLVILQIGIPHGLFRGLVENVDSAWHVPHVAGLEDAQEHDAASRR